MMAGVWEAGPRGAWSLLLPALGEGGVVVGSRGWGVKGGLGCFPHSSSSLLVFASQISTFLAVLGPDHSVREVAGLFPRALPALCFLDLSRSVRFSKALPFPGQPSYSGCRRF